MIAESYPDGVENDTDGLKLIDGLKELHRFDQEILGNIHGLFAATAETSIELIHSVIALPGRIV